MSKKQAKMQARRTSSKPSLSLTPKIVERASLFRKECSQLSPEGRSRAIAFALHVGSQVRKKLHTFPSKGDRS